MRVPGKGSRVELLLGGILALCLLRLWVAPLSSSFWVDEMGTSFVARYGADHPSLRAAPQVPASIYYVLPRFADHFFGLSEIAYRVPSLLAMLVAILLIGRIAAKAIHPDAGWFAVFACMGLSQFNYQAADARPYALATLVTSAGFLFLIRWLDSARWADAVGFIVAGALLWRVHLVMWPLYIAFAAYTLFRLWRNETAVGWRSAVAVFAVIGISLIPVLVQALALNREAAEHVVVRLPSGSDLINSLKFGLVLAVCTGAAVLSRCFCWPYSDKFISAQGLTLVLAWWLSVPLSLFGYSWLTRNSVFVSRYLTAGLPGAGLAATVVAAAFVPPRHWKALAVLLGLGILIYMGHWGEGRPVHHGSDWKKAAQVLNERAATANVPVICPSPFIEAKPPVWRPDYPMPGFLYAPLLVYQIHATPYLFPFEDSPEAERQARTLARERLAPSGRFFIYGGSHAVLYWRDWFHDLPELSGWSSARLGPFGDVEVVEFDSPRLAARPADKISGRSAPIGEVESKAGFQKTAWDNAAAFQH